MLQLLWIVVPFVTPSLLILCAGTKSDKPKLRFQIPGRVDIPSRRGDASPARKSPAPKSESDEGFSETTDKKSSAARAATQPLQDAIESAREMKLISECATAMEPTLLKKSLLVDVPSQVEARQPESLTADMFHDLCDQIDTFIFDADGVLWLGDDVMPGSPKLVEYLLKRNKRVIVLTNNATKSRAVYAKKLAKLGYPAKIGKDSLVNPAAVAADTLKQAGLAKGGARQNKKVYMIGSKGMRDEMDLLGIQYFGHGMEKPDDSDGSAFMFDIELEEKKENVGAVLIGYEKHFNYHKLMKAANYLQDKQVTFVATNEDETCPGPVPGVIIPDAGPIVAAVKVATGRSPITVGKPCSPAFEYIQRRWNVDPSRTLMVGDRTNTDVKFGRDHGLRTLLVLSGCHQLTDVAQNQTEGRDDMVPDFHAPCLGALVPQRNAA